MHQSLLKFKKLFKISFVKSFQCFVPFSLKLTRVKGLMLKKLHFFSRLNITCLFCINLSLVDTFPPRFSKQLNIRRIFFSLSSEFMTQLFLTAHALNECKLALYAFLSKILSNDEKFHIHSISRSFERRSKQSCFQKFSEYSN